MAKDKSIEVRRKAERLRRIEKRKRERLEKFTANRKFRKNSQGVWVVEKTLIVIVVVELLGLLIIKTYSAC